MKFTTKLSAAILVTAMGLVSTNAMAGEQVRQSDQPTAVAQHALHSQSQWNETMQKFNIGYSH